jgi:hypothetical protein
MKPAIGHAIEFMATCEFCEVSYSTLFLWQWDGLTICSSCRLRLMTDNEREAAGETDHIWNTLWWKEKGRI